MIKARDEAVASGTIPKYTEDWYRMCAAIDSVTQAIEEGTTSLIEYNNAIRDIDWQKFDLIQERISDITAESEFLIELLDTYPYNDKEFTITVNVYANAKVVTESGISIFVKFVQFQNTLHPIKVTELGIMMLSKDLQS